MLMKVSFSPDGELLALGEAREPIPKSFGAVRALPKWFGAVRVFRRTSSCVEAKRALLIASHRAFPKSSSGLPIELLKGIWELVATEMRWRNGGDAEKEPQPIPGPDREPCSANRHRPRPRRRMRPGSRT